MQRVGRGYTCRHAIAAARTEARRAALARLAATILLQRVGRGYPTRETLGCAARARLPAVRVLQRVGRGYAVRCAMSVLDAARWRELRRQRDETARIGRSDDPATVLALRQQQDDLRRELYELQWRVDDMLTENSFPVGRADRPHPVKRWEEAVAVMGTDNEALEDYVVCYAGSPVRGDRAARSLEVLDAEVARLLADNAAMEATLAAQDGEIRRVLRAGAALRSHAAEHARFMAEVVTAIGVFHARGRQFATAADAGSGSSPTVSAPRRRHTTAIHVGSGTFDDDDDDACDGGDSGAASPSSPLRAARSARALLQGGGSPAAAARAGRRRGPGSPQSALDSSSASSGRIAVVRLLAAQEPSGGASGDGEY